MSSFSRFLLSAGLTAVACSSQVRAAAETWTNGSTDSQWNNTSANWSGAASTFTNGDSATFGSTGAGTIAVGAGISAAGITFGSGAAGYVFTGAALTSTGNVIANESVEFDNAVTFGTVRVVSGKTLTFTGGGTLTPDGTATSAGGSGAFSFTAGAYTLGNIISQNGGGTVNMTFTGASTFTGAATQLAYTNAANLTYSSSGTSAFTGQIRIGRGGAGVLTQTSGMITASGEVQLDGLNGSGTLDLQGGTFDANTQQITVQAAQTVGTGLLKVEGGTLKAGTIALNSGTGGTSTFQLTSGTVNVNTISQANGGTKSISLSGGTLGTNTVTTATWSTNMSLDGNVSLRAANASGTSAAITLSGVLSGTGGFTKIGAGTLTLSAANTYTGNTIVSAGTLNLADNAQLKFALGANGVNNGITGAGTLTLDGDFVIDLSGAAATGSWNLVDVANLNETFSPTFSVVGWTDNGNDTWTLGKYTFSEATGTVSAVPEPSTWILVGMAAGLTLIVRRNRRVA